MTRFYTMDLFERNKADLIKSIENGEIECLVDEQKEGIVAYVLPSFKDVMEILGVE